MGEACFCGIVFLYNDKTGPARGPGCPPRSLSTS